MNFIKRFLGPEIFSVINQGVVKSYEANLAETVGQKIMSVIGTGFLLGKKLWPVILIYCYRSGFDRSFQMAQKYGVWLILIYGVAFLIRGLGRNFSKKYLDFSLILAEGINGRNRILLRRYDFEFDHWPVDYEFSTANLRARKYIPNDYQMMDVASSLPLSFRKYLASFVANVIARRLVYPGSLQMVQSSVGQQLLVGRSRLVAELHGQRNKLISSCNNTIDTMFVDRRNEPRFPRGNILVVTCEGNAGFYEVGILAAVLEAGYSVLGWNHPGFGGSTGDPFPENECAAIDVVMQFAAQRLGFPAHETVVVAWSIGGFTATWLGMNYPDLRGMILDAVFDDVLPLALHTMPSGLETVVRDVIKMYFNLHIGNQIQQYNGPISFIRRSQEEIIVTDNSNVQNQRRSNRINFLLQSFLRFRYPHIFNDENDENTFNWIALSSQDRALQKINEYKDEECINLLTNYFGQPNRIVAFPSEFGLDFDQKTKKALSYYLIDFYLSDFDATHCVPLTATFLKIPYHPWDVVLNN